MRSKRVNIYHWLHSGGRLKHADLHSGTFIAHMPVDVQYRVLAAHAPEQASQLGLPQPTERGAMVGGGETHLV